ncbi:DUF452 family protein [Lentisphaerota bacterium ZTH]|nr:DUF452 family protein [Lentisphaerota bacterium]WET06337.1 DUF452 family protein [Lentisphaerota bacterium ZTH]
MKRIWINMCGSSELLLFFNGWSMDDKPFRHLAGAIDVLMFYDYTVTGNAVDIAALVNNYRHISLAAWSLGVYAAAEVFEGYELGFETAVAINGTLSPIDADAGIPPEIFQSTVNAWSEPAKKRFIRRECSSRYQDFFLKNEPERSVEDQKQELIALQQRILQQPEMGNIFRTAVIGAGDKIFPTASQRKAWAKQNIAVKELEQPHYFFADLNTWEEVKELG